MSPTVFKTTAPVFITTSVGWIQFLRVPANTYYCLSDYSHPTGYEVVSHCGFELEFPHGLMLSKLIFMCLLSLFGLRVEILRLIPVILRNFQHIHVFFLY